MSLSVLQKIKNLTDEDLTILVKRCYNKKEVLNSIAPESRDNRALQFLSNRIKELNIDISHFSKTTGGERKYPKELMEKYVAESFSWTGVLNKMGLRMIGSNHITAKRLVSKYNLDTSHFDPKKAAHMTISETHYDGVRRYTNEQIFCENSTALTSSAKLRILKDSLIPYECSSCGLKSTWNGKPIVLQLEHINGIKNDHRLENLTFLCPNCHSQTGTWGTKKRNNH